MASVEGRGLSVTESVLDSLSNLFVRLEDIGVTKGRRREERCGCESSFYTGAVVLRSRLEERKEQPIASASHLEVSPRRVSPALLLLNRFAQAVKLRESITGPGTRVLHADES